MSDFEKIIISHCTRMYSLCLFATVKSNREFVLNRRFIGKLQLEASWMEETMDAAGARRSDKWFPFREAVSTIKMLTSVTYDVLHVKKSSPFYNLIDIERDLNSEVLVVLEDLYRSLIKTSRYIVKKAKECGLHNPGDSIVFSKDLIDIEDIPLLNRDRKVRKIENPGKTLIYLATEFLNLKSDMKLFYKVSNLNVKDSREFIPGYFSEDKLRLVLVRFHNLQSLYDTYLSESDIEDLDPRLKVLRGHISIIYHMIKSATKFTHYYERHIVPREKSRVFKPLLPMDIRKFLDITIKFFMSYPTFYFNGAKELCFKVIDSYADIKEMFISIPSYRGFHVRPSTLVSKIVNYYGGKVKMEFNGVLRDPSTTLELFRLNEEINFQKRLKLFEELKEVNNTNLRQVLNELIKKELVIEYKSHWDRIEIDKDESVCEYMKRAFTSLLASGVIDIKMDLKIKFTGDIRSLDDIALLADSGYGEDKFGNNIPLPKKLSYLKR